MHAKFRCAPLRIKKALGIFRELISTIRTRTNGVAVRDPPSGCKNVLSLRLKVELQRNCSSSVGSLFHARGTATEKALLPIVRLVHGMTKLPLTDACSKDRAGMLATGVSRSAMLAGT